MSYFDEDVKILSEAEIEIEEELDQKEGIVVVPKKNLLSNESSESSPLEDKHGRDLWVRTRMCFCPSDAETDCRFHSTKESGWEECPHLEAAQKNSKMKGRWLWGHNPLYGKPLTEEEEKEQEAQALALASIEISKKELEAA